MSLPEYTAEKELLHDTMEFDIQETEFLYEIGRIFSSTHDMKAMLNAVLELIARRFDILRGSINIYDNISENIRIDISYGYSQEEVQRGIYKPGEGVVGTVFKTGKPIVVSSIDDEPLFLNRTGARKKGFSQNSVFICVPVFLDTTVIGTISMEKPNMEKKSCAEQLRALSIVSIMIAHGVNERRGSLKREEDLKNENMLLKIRLSNRQAPGNLVGSSHQMTDLFEKIYLVAPTNSTVLITGESGTGKELIADALYQNSLRRDGPYIKVNIAALPDNLIESELFGHEKGAFTGAISQKKGRFELANGGTIFLDEIGDLNLQSQVKLLRVLQERTIERLGGARSIALDVRIISATHHNLEEKVERGEFRQDLYYRLNVFPIYSVPLRERKADIMLLADHFLEYFNTEMGKNIKRISTEAIDLLVSYHWPGNVRELENCIQRAVIISKEDVIRSIHLPPSLQMAGNQVEGVMNLEDLSNRFMKEIITDTLKITRGNITRAAEKLGTTKRILNYRIKQLNIDFMAYRGR
jgi:Nif-specific regulatory protein